MQNLERRPSGIYAARLTIPPRLRSIVGATAFIASTGTPQLAMAKLVASELLAGWRRHLFELERFALAGTSMNEQSIIKIADGHPLLRSSAYFPIHEAASLLGLKVEDILRQVADGHLSLFCRLLGNSGYLTSYDEFEPDDPELETALIPSVENRPGHSRLHRAFGVLKLLKSDAMPLANGLLAGTEFHVLVLEALDQTDGLNIFVPGQCMKFDRENIEISASELDGFRRKLAESISATALDAARLAIRTPLPVAEASKSKMLLSDALGAYCQLYLTRKVTSEKEIERIRTGIALLDEFEGDMEIGAVDADILRHFRDHHLASMPANENRVRIKFGTTSMTESVVAIKDIDWPIMSADERDQRMQWICRMFRWFHSQKWIGDDPSTGLRGESVLTKAQRSREETNRVERTEFTPEEIGKIFSSPIFQMNDVQQTKAGTFRTFQPFHYWLPLLGLFTGARIGELCQLRLDDIRCQDGVWLIDINKNTTDKSLKNDWSVRRIPLHPLLLKFGFAEWHACLATEGYVRLFPELSWNATNRYAKEPIRAMSQFLEKAGMPRDGRKVFHSFRHGMNNEVQKRTSMPDIMRKRLMGHEPGAGVNERHYLSDPKPADMLSFISTLEMHLPHISKFDFNAGLKSISDALNRKNGGRGAPEQVGASSNAA